jgi:hypothetical protein
MFTTRSALEGLQPLLKRVDRIDVHASPQVAFDFGNGKYPGVYDRRW